LALFDSLIQRLQNTRINGRNHIYRRIQFFLRHSRFPCIRKAPLYSWVAQSHHRHRQANEHLFSVSETFRSMGVAIESSKISFLQNAHSFRHPMVDESSKKRSSRYIEPAFSGSFPIRNPELELETFTTPASPHRSGRKKNSL
jgi:hypothetical protein